MTKQPFFAKRGDAFTPNQVSNGAWDPNSMHGRVVVGLLAHVIEARHGAEALRIMERRAAIGKIVVDVRA